MWNVESSGAQRPYRILQKRGVIVDGDDYLPVTDTYPSHPMSDVKPTFQTRSELLNFRKDVECQDIRGKKNV